MLSYSATVPGLLIDTDPALGIPLCDVDDALAVRFCVHAGLPVVGLTSVYGNASGEDTHAIALRLGDAFDLPVFRGADGPGEVDNAAVDVLVQHDGDVLAIGPLTNIAAALLRGARWSRLVVLGGTSSWLPNLRPLHTTEFNFAVDPVAAALVLPHVDVLFPMEPCRQVLFHEEDLEHLPGWLRERCVHWTRLSPLVTWRTGFHPWDLLPALWLDSPKLFTFIRGEASLRTGRAYPGHIDCLRTRDARTDIAVHVDAEGFVARWRSV